MTSITPELISYGYTPEGPSDFSKELENGFKESWLSYGIDEFGNITGVGVQLYYRSDYENFEEELRYIISTTNLEFDSGEVDAFIESIKTMMAGEYGYNSLKTTSEGSNYTLTIGLSDDYVDIHSN